MEVTIAPAIHISVALVIAALEFTIHSFAGKWRRRFLIFITPGFLLLWLAFRFDYVSFILLRRVALCTITSAPPSYISLAFQLALRVLAFI